jgi:hypothetical protein
LDPSGKQSQIAAQFDRFSSGEEFDKARDLNQMFFHVLSVVPDALHHASNLVHIVATFFLTPFLCFSAISQF